ncbi:hypothetical protein [Lacimicrobium alkaliphilum]|uniref:Uncharacterized protein n=1 Tax=Lacimicrobium alkaliphilum TaxID=1526571 RepID=A0A0U3AVL5_9ALTE|nr:hypothetical protein [Lacimicrobium alkaliphilum]ALS96984.1 hypothetical protein AT746_00950 [Lacimicrobium alkaliphilum]
MSNVTPICQRYGHTETISAIKERIRTILAGIQLCNELIAEEPEFRYQHEIQRDRLVDELNYQQQQIASLRGRYLAQTA